MREKVKALIQELKQASRLSLYNGNFPPGGGSGSLSNTTTSATTTTSTSSIKRQRREMEFRNWETVSIMDFGFSLLLV